MKKLKFLKYIAILILAFSCSNDDAKEQQSDPIIGTWNPTREVDFNNDGTQVVDIANVCELKGRFTFLENGSLAFKTFDGNDIDDCVEDFVIQEGISSWEKISETTYEIIISYIDPSTDQVETNTQIYKITFPDAITMRLASVGELDYNEFSRLE